MFPYYSNVKTLFSSSLSGSSHLACVTKKLAVQIKFRMVVGVKISRGGYSP